MLFSSTCIWISDMGNEIGPYKKKTSHLDVFNTISYTVYNCRLAQYEFYWPDIFRIRTIVHCITNLSWFCNQTSYLMFSILGQWIYHDCFLKSMLSNYDINWYGSLMFLDSDNLTFAFSKGSNYTFPVWLNVFKGK
jgi:hypothetical protein